MYPSQRKLNPSIINKFRETINEHSLIYHIYKDIDGKDQWGLICSAMDWIDVAVTGIDTSKLSFANSNEASISVMTFISCIDVMWEGVQQLHRVFVKQCTIPFENNHSVFQKDAADNEYWKAIRAMFAAHPVNLKNITGKECESKERWFASWSGAFLGNGDISVLLYSNIPGKQSEKRDLETGKLMDFITQRYNYLYDLIDVVKSRREEYLEKYRQTPLRTCAMDTPPQIVDYANYLIGENELRWYNPYYFEKLQEIRDAFSVSVKEKNNQIALFQYQQALLKALPVIHEAIAKLDYDICDENSFVDVAPPIEYQYACEHIFDEHKADLMDFGISKMKQYFGDIINYDECQSRLEIAVLTKAGIYFTQNIKPASANTIYLSSQE